MSESAIDTTGSSIPHESFAPRLLARWKAVTLIGSTQVIDENILIRLADLLTENKLVKNQAENLFFGNPSKISYANKLFKQLVRNKITNNKLDKSTIRDISLINQIIALGNQQNIWAILPIKSISLSDPTENPLTRESWSSRIAARIFWKNLYQKIRKLKSASHEELNYFVVMSLVHQAQVPYDRIGDFLAKLNALDEHLTWQASFPMLRLKMVHTGHWDYQVLPPITLFLMKKWQKHLTKSSPQLILELNPHELQNRTQTYCKEFGVNLPTRSWKQTHSWLLTSPWVNLDPVSQRWHQGAIKSYSLKENMLQLLWGTPTPQAQPKIHYTTKKFTISEEIVDDSLWIWKAILGFFSAYENDHANLGHALENFNISLKHNLYINDNLSLPLSRLHWTLLLDWIIPQVQTAKRKTSMLLRTLRPLARYLIITADVPMHKSGANERLRIYRNLIDYRDDVVVGTELHQSIRSFDNWLVRTYTLEPIANEIKNEEFVSEMRVDAQLITFDEYEACKQLIVAAPWHFPTKENAKYAYIALILGFRLGLRRMEILKLKIMDFRYRQLNGITQITLMIRFSENRSLKTANAVRFFHLHEWLSEQEYLYIKEWFLQRKNKDLLIKQNKVDWFFAVQHGDRLINAQNLIEQLIGLVRKVCANPDLNFHHLRHSFASWQYLGLANKYFDVNAAPLFARFPETHKWLEGFIQAPWHQHLSRHDTSMYVQLGRWMGHASTETTLHHYIHWVPLVQGLTLLKPYQAFSNEMFREISGIGKKTTIEYAKDKSALSALRMTQYLYRNNIDRELCPGEQNAIKPWENPYRIDKDIREGKLLRKLAYFFLLIRNYQLNETIALQNCGIDNSSKIILDNFLGNNIALRKTNISAEAIEFWMTEIPNMIDINEIISLIEFSEKYSQNINSQKYSIRFFSIKGFDQKFFDWKNAVVKIGMELDFKHSASNSKSLNQIQQVQAWANTLSISPKDISTNKQPSLAKRGKHGYLDISFKDHSGIPHLNSTFWWLVHLRRHIVNSKI